MQQAAEIAHEKNLRVQGYDVQRRRRRRRFRGGERQFL